MTSLLGRPYARQHRRVGIVCLTILLIVIGHLLTPIGGAWLHAVHILLRKLFLLPVILAAAWFGLRGALLAGAAISLIYLPYIWWDWTGNVAENINQYGELITIWITALLAGTVISREKATLENVARMHEGSLITLVSALDAREHDTQLHSLRVRNYALRLGCEMKLSANELRTLSEGALLHDVGKIGVPDQILLKTGSLSPDEWTIMREHPETGSRILSSAPFLAEAARIVECHHEKYDGTGYPQRLCAEEIPLGARVFAVVDVFDALTTVRPYHEPISMDEAKEVIQQDSGTHFDPCVVAAFLRIKTTELLNIQQQLDSYIIEKNTCGKLRQ
ncbi:MAG: HD domain-containing protein [Candidatus Hydrogenedentes bacterium]|nr:HD domain-containing protein [Candidatus Hydrogenedentota bacterium]